MHSFVFPKKKVSWGTLYKINSQKLGFNPGAKVVITNMHVLDYNNGFLLRGKLHLCKDTSETNSNSSLDLLLNENHIAFLK